MTTENKTYPYKQKIVTFGGGTGQFYLLSGLRELNFPPFITAVAGIWDSGGSSGRLRTEHGLLPQGDIRRCALALIEDEGQRRVAQRLFDDRLEEFENPLKGHSLGNLIGSRLDYIYHGIDRGTDALRDFLRISAHILPASLSDLQLIGRTQKGIAIEGETNIDLRRKREDFDPHDKILRIYFNTRPDPNPRVTQAIAQADKIIFAPGDLYTSILPHLLIPGVQEAIVSSRAKLIFILNLMTKEGETDFFKASDHLKALLFYLEDCGRIDFMIASTNHHHSEVIEYYKQWGQEPVQIDEDECKKLSPNLKIVRADLARYMRKEHLLRHDPQKLASTILRVDKS